ncbi:hypothetical protein MTR67_026269 [Solanum verrucosum]|uniref:Uncharacterized protein n=1 Tax=Solanum verrucosum TaxID=315347 RepID=A0AAF0R7E5_SOLVR|nr:hypothetical protein MTR67_026269 [Solanum verrucosum]
MKKKKKKKRRRKRADSPPLLKAFVRALKIGKANVVAYALSMLSMHSPSHVEEGKKELPKDVHRLARLGVWLVDSNEGEVMVMNWVESSLLSEVKEKQDKYPIFLELKGNVHKKKLMTSKQGRYGVLQEQQGYMDLFFS